jgi:hypothetical protein
VVFDINIIISRPFATHKSRMTPEQRERNIREKAAQRKIDEEVQAKVLNDLNDAEEKREE